LNGNGNSNSNSNGNDNDNDNDNEINASIQRLQVGHHTCGAIVDIAA